MIETVNSFLLSVDKFMFEMHLRKPTFMYTTGGPFTKNKKKEYKNLKRQEVQGTFIKIKQMKLAFKTRWFMKIFIICLEEQI